MCVLIVRDRFSSAIAKHWDELIPSFPPLTLITSPQVAILFHFTLSSFLNHSITSSFSNHVNLLLFPFHIALMTFAPPSFDGNLLNRQFWISANGGRAVDGPTPPSPSVLSTYVQIGGRVENS